MGCKKHTRLGQAGHWPFRLIYQYLGIYIERERERGIRDRKVASSNPGRSGGRIFFSRVNFVCWLLFGVRSNLVLLQRHVKDLGHSAKSAGGRLHLNAHTSWPNEVGMGWLCRCPGIVWEPIRKQAYTQLVRKHSVTVVSARWATVDWSWTKERN